ncbi:FAD-binding oxidoreductase [Gordonia paraffinivorans]|uniref:FAD-binding oxidoreductase n=1 Tax=Gordonia paraffinivorans TaxID=175628 RepID=UPI000D608362|nr:FAD-linked oxidase C-terminal domain-containing protein [Gordonia paraffinivorans]PWD42933.1 FAD-binding oxidoreductase [Gordonia paraffinivorans]
MGIVDDLVARGVPVLTDPESVIAARTDRSGAAPDGKPRGVVRAESVDDVVATLRAAHAHRVPVVPRGAGSGLAGGALAGAETLVLDVSGLNRILEIDPVDGIAVVEPGVITAELDRAAGEHGLRFTPDPASARISTVGGNIATNAGGMRCVRYGATGQSVLGLDVVLADGTRISTGRRTVKGVSGFDLTALLVGSEGALGVIVGATVQLLPQPEQTVTLAAGFDDVGAAARACSAVARRRANPALLELLDHATLTVVDRAQGADHSERSRALVIAQTEGVAAREEAAIIGEVFGEEARWCEISTDDESAEVLVAARRLALPSIEEYGRALIEDICVPRSRLPEAFDAISEIGRQHGVDVFGFAHAGDGTIHPILSFDRNEPQVPAAVSAAADDIFGLAIDLGGTVSGEHGIGVLKRDWLAREIGPESLAVQRAIKDALDPRGILNPGKGI